MDNNKKKDMQKSQQEQTESNSCYTVRDLLHPEERKDSVCEFDSWQTVGKF